MLVLHHTSQCDICWDSYSDSLVPYAIPCGHIACLPCLEGTYPTLCPLCRKPYLPVRAKKLHVDRFEKNSDSAPLESRLATSHKLLVRLASALAPEDDTGRAALLALTTETDVWLNENHHLEEARPLAQLRLEMESSDLTQALSHIEAIQRSYRQKLVEVEKRHEKKLEDANTRIASAQSEINMLRAQLDQLRHRTNSISRPASLDQVRSLTRLSTTSYGSTGSLISSPGSASSRFVGGYPSPTSPSEHNIEATSNQETHSVHTYPPRPNTTANEMPYLYEISSFPIEISQGYDDDHHPYSYNNQPTEQDYFSPRGNHASVRPSTLHVFSTRSPSSLPRSTTLDESTLFEPSLTGAGIATPGFSAHAGYSMQSGPRRPNATISRRSSLRSSGSQRRNPDSSVWFTQASSNDEVASSSYSVDGDSRSLPSSPPEHSLPPSAPRVLARDLSARTSIASLASASSWGTILSLPRSVASIGDLGLIGLPPVRSARSSFISTSSSIDLSPNRRSFQLETTLLEEDEPVSDISHRSPPVTQVSDFLEESNFSLPHRAHRRSVSSPIPFIPTDWDNQQEDEAPIVQDPVNIRRAPRVRRLNRRTASLDGQSSESISESSSSFLSREVNSSSSPAATPYLPLSPFGNSLGLDLGYAN